MTNCYQHSKSYSNHGPPRRPRESYIHPESRLRKATFRAAIRRLYGIIPHSGITRTTSKRIGKAQLEVTGRNTEDASFREVGPEPREGPDKGGSERARIEDQGDRSENRTGDGSLEREARSRQVLHASMANVGGPSRPWASTVLTPPKWCLYGNGSPHTWCLAFVDVRRPANATGPALLRIKKLRDLRPGSGNSMAKLRATSSRP